MRKRIARHPHTTPRNRKRTHLRTRTPRPGSRGVAMLLVLISLMMATVLTTSYVASRDNSAAIGQNAAAAAAARWAAESGMDFGIAVLETEKDWRSGHLSGRLLSDYPLVGSSIDLDLVDITTGMPPTAGTEYVRMTVTASVDGVSQSAVADCHVPLNTDPTIDVDLSEFALFASARLELRGEATIARWPSAPLSALGERILIGTRATGASSIDVADAAAAVDTTVFVGPGASPSLVAVATGSVPEKVGLQDFISLPASPAPGVAAPSGSSTAPDLIQSGGTAITNTNMRWKRVDIKGSGTRTLRGNITVVADEDFAISGFSKLFIDGNVNIVVFGDLALDTGAIELKNGASLVMFLGGNAGNQLNVRDSYIGNLRADDTRDASGRASYMNPERIEIYSMPAGSPGNWTIDKNSVIKGSIYAPNAARVELKEQTALYGRLAAREIRISENACVFYDPSLRSRGGYSTLDGPLYETNGRLKPEFRNIVSLDAGVLQGLADTLNVVVRSVLGLLFRPASYSPTTPVVGPTDPTPRTVEVEYRVVSIGDSLDSWE